MLTDDNKAKLINKAMELEKLSYSKQAVNGFATALGSNKPDVIDAT